MSKELVLLNKSKEKSIGTLNFATRNGVSTLELFYNGNSIADTSPYPFHSLIKIREELELEGLVILCNGSRFDVYTSGMQSETTSAYVFNMGLSPEKVVDIFDEVEDDSKIGSVKEQQEFHEKWYTSLQKK